MATGSERWYRQPVLWLALAILSASIAACIGLILLAARLPPEPLQPPRDSLLRVPVTREAPPAP